MNSFDRIPIHQWLIQQGLTNASSDKILQGFCDRLGEAGLPLARGFIGLATLHPLINAYSFVWDHGVMQQDTFSHEQGSSETWRESPFHHMISAETPYLRERLEPPDRDFRFASWKEFAGRGMTDWIGMLFSFGWNATALNIGRVGLVVSWMSDRPGGFSDAECMILRELTGTLALALKASNAYPIARGLLTTYLGGDAAQHVLNGEVQAGRVHGIDAAILFADLRDFTALSERLPGDQIAAVLNRYLDAVGSCVQKCGGQVLKFLGDGILATFAVEDDAQVSCLAALTAAEQAVQDVAALNRSGFLDGPLPALDVALHLGTVLYGNVGAADRLDFTVVGPAVNIASRIEGLCGKLDEPVLVSAAFRDAVPQAAARLIPAGSHRLKGVSEPVAVFAPR
jgi:adenylate cyclase